MVSRKENKLYLLFLKIYLDINFNVFNFKKNYRNYKLHCQNRGSLKVSNYQFHAWNFTTTCKLSIKLQKPTDYYFYVDSLKGGICIATNDEDKIIYKNNDEHTSPIQNTYKVGNEYLVVTENTIYVISAKTQIK